jgi:hypothetical protein
MYGRGSRRRLAGFDVFVRRFGRFEKINIAPLVKEEAIQFGAVRVGTTAAATFKIQPTRLPVSQRFRAKGIMADFYKKAARGSTLFIEKRERRIKSKGELQEITFKGLRSLKSRKMWRL